VSALGFTATDIGCNSHRVERTSRDVRLDGADHYFVVFLVRGQLAMTHNDQTLRLAAGDVALVDATRPVTYLVDNPGAVCNILSLNLPRQSLVAHLGFEPRGGLYQRGGTPAGRLLFELIRDLDNDRGSPYSPADTYMQLAVYDLVGALFAPSDPWPVSSHAARLFSRVRSIIKEGFTDPNFGPGRGGRQSGDFVALPPKTLYAARFNLQ
jgi:AraC family transcriptional regulator, positive regulator of tynA and feaB